MNREQRRADVKKHKKHGYTQKEAEKITAVNDLLSRPRRYAAGDKVCLRYEKLVKQPDYATLRAEYREFVENHKTAVLTVEIPPEYEHRCLVTLAEDTHEPKWLWWEGDLRRPDEPDEQ